MVPWRSSTALALHALGASEEARTLAGEELALARVWAVVLAYEWGVVSPGG